MKWWFVVVARTRADRYLGLVDWDEGSQSMAISPRVGDASRFKDESAAIGVMEVCRAIDPTMLYEVEQRQW